MLLIVQRGCPVLENTVFHGGSYLGHVPEGIAYVFVHLRQEILVVGVIACVSLSMIKSVSGVHEIFPAHLGGWAGI